jgi:hypothetical protein
MGKFSEALAIQAVIYEGSSSQPAHQPASLPSMTTAGTVRTPCSFALAATSGLCMSWMTTSVRGTGNALDDLDGFPAR